MSRWLLKIFRLDWVAVNKRSEFGRRKLIIVRYEDGSVPREELLQRSIPWLFISMMRWLHLSYEFVVKEVITEEKIAAELKWFDLVNEDLG